MAEEYAISKEAMFEIVVRKIDFWKGAIYSANLDVKVANITGNKKMLEEATQNLKAAIATVDALEEEIKEINKS